MEWMDLRCGPLLTDAAMQRPIAYRADGIVAKGQLIQQALGLPERGGKEGMFGLDHLSNVR